MSIQSLNTELCTHAAFKVCHNYAGRITFSANQIEDLQMNIKSIGKMLSIERCTPRFTYCRYGDLLVFHGNGEPLIYQQ